MTTIVRYHHMFPQRPILSVIKIDHDARSGRRCSTHIPAERDNPLPAASIHHRSYQRAPKDSRHLTDAVVERIQVTIENTGVLNLNQCVTVLNRGSIQTILPECAGSFENYC